MIGSLLGVDDGLSQGNFDFADILFLIAAILFALEVVLRLLPPRDSVSRINGVLIPLGLTLVAVAWFAL